MPRRLSSFCRPILFDERGAGSSDPVDDPPSLEVHLDDARVVIVAGCRVAFDERGVQEMKGIPESRRLFALSP